MSDYSSVLDYLDDISFIEWDTLEALQSRLISDYEKEWEKIKGIPITLSPSAPNRIILNAIALLLFQLETKIDFAGKMNTLKYATGEYLDHLGARLGVKRNGESAAQTTVRFTAAAVRPYAVAIPLGTTVSNSNVTYFKTTEYAEIPIGQTYVDVICACTQPGVIGNELLPGQINTLVDLVPYIDDSKIINLDTTQGGASVEDDASFRERIYLAPSSFSVAGPDDAYMYWVKTYNSNIGDVNIYSPTPVYVEIRFLLKDGTLPTETMRNGLAEYLKTTPVRPLTDEVSVLLPEEVEFDIDLTYYINTSDMARVSQIQKAVDVAKEEYIAWQTGSIGRDINPSELTKRMIMAGAKRVEITSPVFERVLNTAVPRIRDVNVSYGGLEDD